MASITFNGSEINRPAWAGVTGNLLNVYISFFSVAVLEKSR
jgi:hypothetical protein